jgi:hypothetical protein
MSRSGLYSQFGMVAESTVGTYATPTRFLEFNTEGLQLTIDRIESQALRSGQRFQRAGRWIPGKHQIAGPVTFEVQDRGFGLLLAHCFGGGTWSMSTPSGGTNTRDITITAGTAYGRALTVQIGKPDVAGTVNPYSYLGCKVTEASLSSEVDGHLMLEPSFVGMAEVTTQSLATASYPATQLPLSWVGGTFSIAGAALDVKSFSVNHNQGLFTDRYFQRSTGGSLMKEPIEAAIAEVTGSFTTEFESLTQYNRYVNGTEASLAGTWQGTTIEGSFVYQLSIGMSAVRYDGETPTVGGPDILQLTMPFKALASGTLSPYTMVYRTTDTQA